MRKMAGDAVPDTAGQPNLALYRKYRPATFAEVKGQEHVTEPLRRALEHGRVHHAYLFSGPRGCGKTSSARILARSLNCVQGPTPDPCGQCESCVALAPNGPGSIDVIEIDAASHGGVDDARDLRERAFYAPVSGHFKIYIIDEAHMVTREGFNALLKLVEEPPAHLKFVFATTEPDKVVGTIRSRTHHYPFRLVPPPVLRELLEEVLGSEGVRYEPAVLPVVIRAGAGSVRDTLSVLDQLLAGSGESGITYPDAIALLGYTDAGLLDEIVGAFAVRDGGAVFRAVDRAVQSGHDPRRFAADLLDRLRDLIVLSTVEDAARTGLLDAPGDQLERMREQAEKFGAAELTRAAEVLNAGLTEMRGATSPRLLLELTCARVMLPAVDTGDAALLTRLERLERAAGARGAGQVAAPAEQAPAADRPHPAHEPSSETAGSRRAQPAAGPAAETAGHQPAAGAGEAPPEPAIGGREEAPPRAGERRTGPGGTRAAGPSASAEPGPGAGPAGSRAAGPPAGAGAVTAETLRHGWDGVLEAVKKRRRVTWVLLSNAAVRAVETGTVTLEFPREGELKRFTTSGSDELLADVLHEQYGVKWRIAAVPADGRDQQESRGLAASRADRVTERVTGGAPGGNGPAGPEESGAPPGGSGDDGPRGAAGHGGAAGRGGRAEAAPPGRGGAGAGGGTGTAPRGTGTEPRRARGQGGAGPGLTHGSAAGGTRSAGPAGGTGHRASGPGGGQVPPAGPLNTGPADDEPDPAGDADADAQLTGMELIQRELGGQIIGEIEGS
jgi:DNA polymerase III subunit gamma/tau